MTFVNEFVSVDEIARFNLDALMREFDPLGWKQGIPPGFRHCWTIDRANNCFLIMVLKVSVVGPSGHDTPTTGRIALLSINGVRHVFSIERTKESSVMATDRPFRVRWKLAAPFEGHGFDGRTKTPETLEILKSALSTFGHNGAWRQVPQTSVGFEF
jgi:hypothetical protein